MLTELRSDHKISERDVFADTACHPGINNGFHTETQNHGLRADSCKNFADTADRGHNFLAVEHAAVIINAGNRDDFRFFQTVFQRFNFDAHCSDNADHF